MPETTPRPGLKKPLTLPRSFSRVLGRLIALPPAESLPLAKAAHETARTPAERLLAMRLRLRLLQEACEAEAKRNAAPVPVPLATPEPAPEPEPELVEETPPSKPPKAARLMALDPGSDALSMMMSELGGSGDDDDFFGDD